MTTNLPDTTHDDAAASHTSNARRGTRIVVVTSAPGSASTTAKPASQRAGRSGADAPPSSVTSR